MEHLIRVPQVFVSVALEMPAVFRAKHVPQAPVNVERHQHALDKRLDHIVMQRIMYANVLQRWQPAVERQTLVLVVFASVAHQMLAVFREKLVALVLVNVVRQLAALG